MVEGPCCAPCSRRCFVKWLRRNSILVLTVIAVVLGAAIGFGLQMSQVKLSQHALVWINIWGELFLRMLNLIILPLVVSCIVVGISSMESGASGKMGAASLIYIFTTQIVSVALGIVLTVSIHPGMMLGEPSGGQVASGNSYSDVFADLLRNLMPGNMVRAAIQTQYTDRTTSTLLKDMYAVVNGTNHTEARNVTTQESELLYRDGMNIMGVIVLSVAVGMGIGAAGKPAKPLLSFFEALNSVIFKILKVIFWYSPLGILSLIIGAIVEVDDLVNALTSVGMFVLTVIVQNAIYQFIIAPIFMAVILRRNPFPYHLAFLDGIMAACAPPSGAAGLPFMLKDCTENLKLDARVVNFVLPIINTISRVGSAMFIVTALIFVAQTYGLSLNGGQYITMGLLVVCLSGAVAGVPSSSLVVILMISRAVGFPVNERMGLLVMVEWFTDRVRTTTNTQCQGYGTVLVHHFCLKYLDTSDENKNNKDTYGSEESLPLQSYENNV